MKALPYYKFYWQDWRASRTVQRMDYIAQGLYRSLLDECWAEGSMPTDMESLADICGCPTDVMANAWQLLSKCFREQNGRLVNIRLDSERTEQDQKRVKLALNGKRGGEVKFNKPNTEEAIAKQLVSNCHIEEKSREENSKEEKKKTPAPRKQKSVSLVAVIELPAPLLPVAEYLVESWPEVSYGKSDSDRRRVQKFGVEDLWARVVEVSHKCGVEPGPLLFTGLPYIRDRMKAAEDSGKFTFMKDMKNFWGIKEDTRAWSDGYQQGIKDYKIFMERLNG